MERAQLPHPGVLRCAGGILASHLRPPRGGHSFNIAHVRRLSNIDPRIERRQNHLPYHTLSNVDHVARRTPPTEKDLCLPLFNYGDQCKCSREAVTLSQFNQLTTAVFHRASLDNIHSRPQFCLDWGSLGVWGQHLSILPVTPSTSTQYSPVKGRHPSRNQWRRSALLVSISTSNRMCSKSDLGSFPLARSEWPVYRWCTSYIVSVLLTGEGGGWSGIVLVR
jgi:hypothetical protein